jgi:hypothetical protein
MIYDPLTCIARRASWLLPGGPGGPGSPFRPRTIWWIFLFPPSTFAKNGNLSFKILLSGLLLKRIREVILNHSLVVDMCVILKFNLLYLNDWRLPGRTRLTPLPLEPHRPGQSRPARATPRPRRSHVTRPALRPCLALLALEALRAWRAGVSLLEAVCRS